MKPPAPTRLAFDDFVLDPQAAQLLRQGREVELRPKSFEVLCQLVDNAERVLSRDELAASVWQGRVASDETIAQCISDIRRALADAGPRLLQTVPRRGYVLRVAVRPVHAGLAAEPSSPQPAPDAIGHLPSALAPLLGRAAALQDTQRLLQTTRCLTLTGPGGAGKTRLALALAESVRDQFPGGVWWVELDRVSDPQHIAETIAFTVGASNPQQPTLQALVAQLKGRPALLVLDNCEHLVDGCAELAVQLLRALPALRVLATSREALRIAGEVAWSVPPLDLPDATADQSWDDLLCIPSVQLLVQRIRQHDPRFTPAPGQATSLVRICRALDGLPLALELVAAQVGPQSLDQVAARLDSSLQLLTLGQRGGLPHHQTMSAAVDWGHQRLNEAERAVFARLSVFVGGWTLDSAVAACQGLPIADDEVPALLGRLHRVSMVLVQEEAPAPGADGSVRFRMLEPIRQFASEKLQALGHSTAVRHQLLAWYVGRCKAVATQLAGPHQAQGYRFLAAEFDNLRALLAWSRQADLASGLQLAADLWRFWQVKGHAKELLAWFDDALPRANDVPALVRAEASNAAGVMARTCGRYADAVRLHTTAMHLQRELGRRRGEAVALNNLCVVARDQYDHPSVERHGRASLQIAREIGDRHLEGLGLMHLGTALRGQGRAADAEASFRQSFEIFTELGETRALGALLNFLGNLALAGGRWAEAGRCFDESLVLNQALGDHWGLGISTCNQAALRVATHDPAAALPILMQSLAHYRQAGARHGMEECFEL
ncbi:MAG: ATP-binding protein, partial [Aquabacterium sp.]